MSFNPRALTSPDFFPSLSRWDSVCFNPRALTSPDSTALISYRFICVSIHGLLRALTHQPRPPSCFWLVSIHGLLRALTYVLQALTQIVIVSIHGLLRALTVFSRNPFISI